ncbi:unnamed protein product [Notodromas monacha]|uniref:Uncharacterized protein n=1 Tax=Notodromas monacha TaxID=399045 RepID=A0A7R9GG40_9CRUS|nr:unnamed protein product [Notodromas monacha]CAG0921303.1 unnamed protein product [Notodromas monacha]
MKQVVKVNRGLAQVHHLRAVKSLQLGAFANVLATVYTMAACAFRGVETRLKYDASNDDTSNLLKNGNDAPSNIVDVKQPLIPKNARFFTGRELLSTLLSIEARQNSGVSSDMLVDGNKSKLMPEMNPVFRIPENSPMFPDGVRFNSCAIVASSGGLLDSNLGEFIG